MDAPRAEGGGGEEEKGCLPPAPMVSPGRIGLDPCYARRLGDTKSRSRTARGGGKERWRIPLRRDPKWLLPVKGGRGSRKEGPSG